MTDSTEYTGDQTEFMDEEPLLEQRVKVLPQKKTTATAEVTTSTKKFPKILVMAMGLVLLIVIVLILLIITLRRSGSSSTTPTPETETVQNQKMGPFMQRLSELEKDLQTADPTQESLPFPPVDLEITLD